MFSFETASALIDFRIFVNELISFAFASTSVWEVAADSKNFLASASSFSAFWIWESWFWFPWMRSTWDSKPANFSRKTDTLTAGVSSVFADVSLTSLFPFDWFTEAFVTSCLPSWDSDVADLGASFLLSTDWGEAVLATSSLAVFACWAESLVTRSLFWSDLATVSLEATFSAAIASFLFGSSLVLFVSSILVVEAFSTLSGRLLLPSDIWLVTDSVLTSLASTWSRL